MTPMTPSYFSSCSPVTHCVPYYKLYLWTSTNYLSSGILMEPWFIQSFLNLNLYWCHTQIFLLKKRIRLDKIYIAGGLVYVFTIMWPCGSWLLPLEVTFKWPSETEPKATAAGWSENFQKGPKNVFVLFVLLFGSEGIADVTKVWSEGKNMQAPTAFAISSCTCLPLNTRLTLIFDRSLPPRPRSTPLHIHI